MTCWALYPLTDCDSSHEPRHCGNTISVGQKTIVYLETYRTEVEEFNIVGTL